MGILLMVKATNNEKLLYYPHNYYQNHSHAVYLKATTGEGEPYGLSRVSVCRVYVWVVREGSVVINVEETAYWCILGLHIFTYTVRYDVLSWDAEWNTIGNNDKKRVKLII